MTILESESGKCETIKRIGPHETYHTLGLYIKAKGTFTFHIRVLKEKFRDWAYRIKHSLLYN